MVNLSIRDELPEDAIVFDNPAFDNSIIGFDVNDCAVYNYWSMVNELMQDDGMSEDEAIDFIEYNTLGVLSYIGDHAPVIVHIL